MPGHIAGPPALFQAGASEAGRDFSARIADATFAATPDMEAGIALRADLRRRAEACGRSPDAVRVLPGLYFFLARTRAEAREMHRRAHAHLSYAQRRASVKSVLGLEELPPDSRVVALIEVDGPKNELVLDAPDGSRIVWVHCCSRSRTCCANLRAPAQCRPVRVLEA